MIEAITKEHYKQKCVHGYAGTKEELYPETQEYWQAMHWMLHLETGIGTCLVPVNVEKREKE